MNSFIELTSSERALFCREAASKLKVPIPAAAVEKDFWVCWVLKLLNELPELSGKFTFKGGTSLSKAWGLIDRFSEDIDIAVDRSIFGQNPPMGAEDATSNSQRKLRIHELQNKNAVFIREVLLPRLNELMGRYLGIEKYSLNLINKGYEVNIEFEYPSNLRRELDGLLPVVLIELVPRADDFPYEIKAIAPLVYEAFPEILGTTAVEVSTLLPERTFLEKLLLIHETLNGFNIGSERKSRHYYDLYKLYHSGVYERVRKNSSLFRIVLEHRQTFFRYNSMDYAQILSKGVQLTPDVNGLQNWRSDYSRSRALIFHEIPTFEELMMFASKFELEFNTWVSNS